MRLELVMSDDTPGHVPMFTLSITEDEMHELSVGRVTALVQEQARRVIDWSLEDVRKNAAKPLARKKAR